MNEKLKKHLKQFTLPAIMILLAGILFFSPKFGFISMISLYNRQQTMRREIMEIDAKIILLQAEMDRLKNDTDYIEKVIREELGMIKKGEKILKE